LGGHSFRVSLLACHLAAAMDLGQLDQLRVQLAATLHDIGKTRLDPVIMSKDQAFDDHDWDEMRRHPSEGYRLIADRVHADVARAVLFHHEWYDGRGYPDGLAGKKIPRLARITAVADAFDAMTGRRTYLPVLTPDEALSQLKDGAGSQFDPHIVHVFAASVFPELAEHWRKE
jgi:HD-GYP domain-containing protein (c-di-GMP phosphodiesterase class II)